MVEPFPIPAWSGWQRLGMPEAQLQWVAKKVNNLIKAVVTL